MAASVGDSEKESISSELESVQADYSAYKNSMKEYEGLAEAEANARKIEAESKAAAESIAMESSKAVEEQAAQASKKADAASKAAVESAKAAKEARTASASKGQKNALSKVIDYLDYASFSYGGLVAQLEYEGFSKDEATYGADYCGADWNELAAKKAQDYLSYTSFSRSGLIELLEYEGFTKEQVEYGATAVGY